MKCHISSKKVSNIYTEWEGTEKKYRRCLYKNRSGVKVCPVSIHSAAAMWKRLKARDKTDPCLTLYIFPMSACVNWNSDIAVSNYTPRRRHTKACESARLCILWVARIQPWKRVTGICRRIRKEWASISIM